MAQFLLFFISYLLGCIPLLSLMRLVGATLHVLNTNDTFQDRLASFGPRLDLPGFFGQLYPIETFNNWEGSPDGCHTFKPNINNNIFKHYPNFNDRDNNLIALIVRGNCSFVDKIRNMQKSGFKAVVVGNNDRSGLVTMYDGGDTSDIEIPSVFITQKEYKIIKDIHYQLKQSNENLNIQLEPNNFLQPLLDVVIVTILSPTIMMLFVYIMWRVRQRQIRKAQLAPIELVNNLPTKTFYLSKRKDNEPEECVICLEDYIDDDEIRILPCHHEFHILCIDPWLTTRKKFCPICKRDICPTPLPKIHITESTPLLLTSSSPTTTNS